MIPFYASLGCWLLTFTAWQYREKQHAKERMEMLKLYRSQSLSEYTNVQTKEKPRPSNFIHQSIQKAYSDLLGDDDD